MQPFNISTLFTWFGDLFRPDRLSETMVLVLGIFVGLLAKNIYTVIMRSFGFVGAFLSRLAIGWWEETRRETPNVVDFAMVLITRVADRQIFLLDPLIGPHRLSDVYLNPRTAIGVRLQTFSVSETKPWVTFRLDDKPPLLTRLARLRRRLFHRANYAPMSPQDRRILKYRRTYAPIENMIGQYMTNEWAAEVALGEPCHIFRFVIALVYEKNAERHVDRHFHALVIWEELLKRRDIQEIAYFKAEHRHRWRTVARIADHYRSSPKAADEFGTIHVMVPKHLLTEDYEVVWEAGPDGTQVPISRPGRSDALPAAALDIGAALKSGVATPKPADDLSDLP
ncbi:MAG: hypothetical protein P4L98_12410 [Ancalomicrobiaceae bacterium]|nr:hypothetical protein [Ancalomicrobiaceae bacterium]